jgi:hypothetical protein
MSKGESNGDAKLEVLQGALVGERIAGVIGRVPKIAEGG